MYAHSIKVQYLFNVSIITPDTQPPATCPAILENLQSHIPG